MTIPATPRRSPVYVGNGIATSYAFAFKVTDPATLVVTVADANDLNSQVLVNGVDYTVTLNGDQNASPGGSISYAGLPVGHRLVITSDTDSSQPTAISNLGAFHANVLEGALDRIVILHQQQQEQIDRAVKVGITSEQDPSEFLQATLDIAANSATQAAASASAASGSATAASASATLAASYATTVGTQSFRNKLINGNFDIWQRGVSAPFTSPVYAADRWRSRHAGGSVIGFSAQQMSFTNGQTDVPGNPKYFLRRQVTSASSVTLDVLDQLIEGVGTFAGETATLSFYARADSARTVTVLLNQYFGVAGSPSAPVPTPAQGAALTTTWQKFTFQFAVPSIAGKTLATDGTDLLQLLFNFPLNQLYTIDIARIQLEPGNVDTPFEQRPVGLELALCQRYYEVLPASTYTAYATTGYGASHMLPFAVTKRATPTVTRVSEASVYNFASSGVSATVAAITYTVSPTVNDMVRVTCGFTAEAEL